MGISDLAHTRDDWWWDYEGLEEEEETLGVEACFPHLGRVHDVLCVWFVRMNCGGMGYSSAYKRRV